MAIESKRMQQRSGTYEQFLEHKDEFLPNEFGIVTSGDPDTSDGKAVYVATGMGEVKRLAFSDEMDSGKEDYELPVMSQTQLGGGRAIARTSETVPVAASENGQLFVPTYPEAGATEEQAQQIEKNKKDIGLFSNDSDNQKIRLELLDGIVFNDANLWEMGAYDSLGEKIESEFAIRSKNRITFEKGSVISLKNYSKYRYLFILLENDKTTYSGWRTEDYVFEYTIDALICVATYDGTKIENINAALSILEIKKPNSMALAKQHVIDSYIPIGELQKGSYIKNGKITTDVYSSGYKCTKNIVPVLPNIKITIENFSRVSSVTLSYFNDAGEYIGNIETEETGTVLTQTFLLPNDCYGLMITALNNSELKCYYTDGDVDLIKYIISNNRDYAKRIEDVKTEIEILNNDINVLESYSLNSKNISMMENHLLSPSNGSVYEYTGYHTSENIIISNAEKIIFKNCVAAIQSGVGYCFKDYDNLYISGSDYNNPGEEVVEVPINAKYLIFTVPNANIEKYSFSYIETGRMSDMYQEYYDNKMFGNIIGSFQSLGVVGDSIASGACSASGGATYIDNYDISWLQFIGKKTGVPCINFSAGGLTTRTWFESPKGYAKLIEENNKCQAYFIALGHNDAFREGDEYIGSKADIDLENKENNADTFYGNYGKIIQTIKEISPKAKIFVVNMPYNDDTRKNYNVAIGEMPNIFNNVYLVDQLQDKFYSKDFMKKCHINAHYNALGYNFIAEHIMDLVKKIMIDNFDEFLEIEFIGTNYSR